MAYNKSGKVWVFTELIDSNNYFEFHRIEIKKGGVCSKHLHKHKWNGFFVESGKLLIRCWKNDYNLTDETILEKGEYTKVPPGEKHQFEALEPTICYEIYWANFDHNDIERDSVGFSKKK